MVKKSFKNLFTEAKQSDSYWTEKAILEFTMEIDKVLKKENISRSELAERIESTPAYVSKILRGETNFTIESMVKIVRAVGQKITIHVTPENETETAWLRVFEGRKKTPISKFLTTPEEMEITSSQCNTTKGNTYGYASAA